MLNIVTLNVIKEEEHRGILGIVDMLVSYACNHQTAEGENTVSVNHFYVKLIVFYLAVIVFKTVFFYPANNYLF